jgi:AraC-like DNA-binding protein/mannose-6-phosphate isomerase-like protein (cupin superfamily)
VIPPIEKMLLMNLNFIVQWNQELTMQRFALKTMQSCSLKRGDVMHSSPFVGESIPSLHYIGTMNKEPGQPFATALHHHPEHAEIMLIAEGNVRIRIDSEWYQLGSGALVIYNSGIWHEEYTNLEERNRIHYLGVNGFQLPGLPSDWLNDNQQQYILPLSTDYPRLEQRFLEIMHHKNSSSSHSPWIANSLTATFLIEILSILTPNQVSEKRGRRKRDIAPVKQYIQEHYDETLSLKELSKISFMSPFHLSRLFKAETGFSPMQYIIFYRMEVAKYFLVRTGDSIAAIAERVGYNSETHFQNLFKKCIGVTPGQFRLVSKHEAET